MNIINFFKKIFLLYKFGNLVNFNNLTFNQQIISIMIHEDCSRLCALQIYIADKRLKIKYAKKELEKEKKKYNIK